MLVKLTFFDIVDIFLVALILFQLYKLIRGTAALRIFLSIFFIYLFWLLAKALNMEMVATLIGQVIGVGVIALIIVFQQEVRRFLLMIGNRYLARSNFTFDKFFYQDNDKSRSHRIAEEIVRASESMASKKTGALIVIGITSRLEYFSDGGEILRAKISSDLLGTIFFKNSPLHDGAVLIQDGLILAARCPLPITEKLSLPSHFGMRHRAALGISEQTDAIVVVISEETGKISVARDGVIREDKTPNEMREILSKEKI
jgi:diadenylate cyclase